MGAYSFNASEVPFELNPQAYSADCNISRAEAFEVIDEDSKEKSEGTNA